MDQPINVYAMLAPAIFAVIIIEVIYCLVKKNGYYTFQDSLIGLGTTVLAQCVNVSVAVGVLAVYGFIYDHFRLTDIPTNVWTWAGCYIGVDFLFYWFHRAGHRINILWAAHVPHHSAEELNYAVALRASLTQRAASFIFYWPLALLGFKVDLILTVVAVNLILQLLPHTRVIPKLPAWIDSWLNTPYHHQVHHGLNPIYWDKNYGGTFIFWDKMFGTYQDQVEPVYYGVSVPPKTWDVTYLNFHWYIVLWKDAMAATHFIDKILIWFMPPGWRPRNLAGQTYEGKYEWTGKGDQPKYATKALAGSSIFLGTQLVLAFAILFWVINHDSPLSTLDKVATTAMLWIGVTLWAWILESKPMARIAQALYLVSMTGFCIYIEASYGYSQEWIMATAATGAVYLLWLGLGLKAPSRSISAAGTA